MAALLVVPLVACDDDEETTQPPQVDGTVRGTVTVEGEPLSGVNVSLAGASSQSATTGSDGSYEFAGVPGGSYSVTLSSIPEGVTFPNIAKTTSISSDGQTVTVDFSGSYIRTSSISGTVSAGGPVSGATVAASGPDNKSATTDGDGNYSITGLRAGDYTVEVSDLPEGTELTTSSKTVTLSAGQSATVNFSGTGASTAKVVIEKMTAGNTNTPINTQNAGGQIDVTLKVDEGNDNVERASLLVEGEEVAFQTFTSAGAPAEGMNVAQAPEAVDGEFIIVFSWTSHAVVRDDDGNPVADENGMAQPLHLDGQKDITAQISTTNGGQSSAQTGTQITLNNSAGGFVGNAAGNTVLVQTMADNTVTGSGGLAWKTGTVYVTVMPLDFDGGVAASATITLWDNAAVASDVQTDSDGSDGFTATYADDVNFGGGGVDDRQVGNVGGNPGMDVDVATIVDGETGPSVNGATPFRLDNVPGTLTNMHLLVRSTRWARAEWEFGVNGTNIDGSSQPTASDPGGTGHASATFYAGSSLDALSEVTSGADLAESFNADEYFVKVVTEDIAGNEFSTFYAGPNDADDGVGDDEDAAGVSESNVESDPDALIGIDKTAPTASLATGSPNMGDGDVMNIGATPPGGTLIDQIQVNSSDTRSGFPPNRVQWKTMFMAPGASGATTCAIGTWDAASSTCSARAHGTLLDFGAGPFDNGHTLGEGYYMSYLTVVDAAGNPAPTITLLNLRDVTAPLNGGLSHDPDLTPGGNETFSSPGTENIDIDSGRLFLGYDDGTTDLGLIFQGENSFGVFGPDEFSTSGDVEVTTQFLGAIENGLGGGIIPSDRARIDLFDFALGVTTTVASQTSSFSTGTNPYASTPPDSWNAASRRPDGQILTSSANHDDGDGIVCRAGDDCDTQETSFTANFVVTGDGSANADDELTNQFQQVVFQTEIGAPGSGLWKQIGTGSVVITESGDIRTFTYSGTIDASQFDTGTTGTPANYTVRAIGINTTEGFGLMETFTIQVEDD